MLKMSPDRAVCQSPVRYLSPPLGGVLALIDGEEAGWLVVCLYKLPDKRSNRLPDDQ
jgi:hypothetical protein